MSRLIGAGLLSLLALSLAAQEPDQPPATPQVPTAQIVYRVPPPPPNATLEELEQTGDRLREQKAYTDAIDYYQAALAKVSGKRASLHNKMGIAYMQITRYKDSEKALKRAIKLDPTFPEAQNNLGVVYYLKKKTGKAIKQYRKALELRETSASFHSNIGSAYFARKDYQRAVVHYARALELDPEIFDRQSTTGIAAHMSSPEDRARYSFLLAKMFALRGDLDRSLRYLRRAMEEGYEKVNDVYKDEAFAGLREDPRFVALMQAPPPALPN